MRIQFRNIYFVWFFVAFIILTANFYLFFNFGVDFGSNTRWFFPLLIIGLLVASGQFWIDFMKERERQKRIEIKFLDFVRNLSSTIKSGISIPASIVQASSKDYSELNPYIKKLSNQIQTGISVHKALQTFANDTHNPMIKRAVSIVNEAEASGGDIENVLTSVTASLVSIKKIKEERKLSIYSQMVQGYIIYFVFIGIMLLLQLKLFPKLSEVGTSLGTSGGLLGTAVQTGAEAVNLDFTFFILILIQGFFAGLMIGKFSEGSIKDGIIHSLILVVSAALIVTTIKGGI